MRSSPTPVEIFFQKHLEAQLPPGFQVFRQASDEIQKSAISLSALDAGILHFLVALQGGGKWIEVGTLTGFSAFCLVRALPAGGRLWTLEKNPELAAKARELLQLSDCQEFVSVVDGDAAETLPRLASEGPFDGIFIDGNKAAYGLYLQWAQENLREGGMIIADNVFLGKSLWEMGTAETADDRWSVATIKKMRAFLDEIFDPEKFKAMLVPTTEGLAVAIKKSQTRA